MSAPEPFVIGQRVRVKAQCYHTFDVKDDRYGSEGGIRCMLSEPCEPWEGIVVGMRYRRSGVVRSEGDPEEGYIPYLEVTQSHKIVLVTRGLWRKIVEVFAEDVEVPS